jgi:hypothetical protein
VARIAERLRGLPGLSLAGNAYRGIAVGAIVADADVVAAEVLAVESGCGHRPGRGAT